MYLRQVYKQQLANLTVGTTEKRYFEGVQGDRGKQGELFGLANLFKMGGWGDFPVGVLGGENGAKGRKDGIWISKDLSFGSGETRKGQDFSGVKRGRNLWEIRGDNEEVPGMNEFLEEILGHGFKDEGEIQQIVKASGSNEVSIFTLMEFWFKSVNLY